MRDNELIDALGRALSQPSATVDAGRVAAIRQAAQERAEMGQHSVTELPVVSRRSARRGWTAAAAAIVIFAAGIGVGAVVAGNVSSPAQTDAEGVVEYSGPIDGQNATGDLLVVMTGIGRVVTLSTGELPILPTGEYYEVWFVAPDDRPDAPNRISAGTFHPDPEGRSDVQFAAAVNPEKYPLVQITAEPGDGDPSALSTVVLEAQIRQ